MSNWSLNDEPDSAVLRHINLIIFGAAAGVALLIFFIFHPQIAQIAQDSPIIVNLMFIPTAAVGFLYGLKITERAMRPSETRSPFKRTIVKLFLFFFIIGGLFSSVSFALNGGTIIPNTSLLDDGLIPWATELVSVNGGATFLIISSIVLMAAATRRIVGLGSGPLSKVVTFVGTFVFFSMISLGFTQGDPTHSQIYLYTFYHAGIIGGALYEMNKLTSNQNMWEDFNNGY